MWFWNERAVLREILLVSADIDTLLAQNEAIRLNPNEGSCVILSKNMDALRHQRARRDRLVARLSKEPLVIRRMGPR